MGYNLAIAALWIRKDRRPDWTAAEDAIRALSFATVWDTDEHFPWESWLDGVPDPPDPLGVYQGLRSAQSYLTESFQWTMAAVELGTHNVTKIDLPEFTVFATGCMTAGETPPDPWQAFVDFGESGLAAAAGFEGWTRYASEDLEERALDFKKKEIRSVAATRALMFAEDLAEEAPQGAETFEFEPPEIWPELWLGPLREVARVRSEDRLLRALMLFAARTFGLLETVLKLDREPSAGDDDDDDDELISPVVREVADLLDESELPGRRSSDVRETFRKTNVRAKGFAEKDMPLLTGEGAHEASAKLGQLFSSLLVAISDLAGERLDEIAEPEQGHMGQYGFGGGRVIHPAYDNYLGWCAAPPLDLDAAQRAVEAIEDLQLRAQLRTDLKPLGEMEALYSRHVKYEEIGDLTLWFTAETSRDGWTLNEPLRRLGAAGVLMAAGAVAWSRPIESV